MVNIEGLSKAHVLMELYENSKAQGMGWLHFDPAPMGEDEAKHLLSKYQYFDYLKGRVMKVDLSSDVEFDEWGYDRDNGQGSAQAIIDELRKKVQ